VIQSNIGPGIWFDCYSRGVVIEENTILNNSGPGIMYEISYTAVIRNNHLDGNCNPLAPGSFHGSNPGSYCGEMFISTSSDTLIMGNTVITRSPIPDGEGYNGNNGITLVQMERGIDPTPGSPGPKMLKNVTVVSNTFVATNCGGRNGIVAYTQPGVPGAPPSPGFVPNPSQAEVTMDNNTYVWESAAPRAPGGYPKGLSPITGKPNGAYWWCGLPLEASPNRAACEGVDFETLQTKYGQERGGQEVLGVKVGGYC
jgi:parallel beta-helix repeat protein